MALKLGLTAGLVFPQDGRRISQKYEKGMDFRVGITRGRDTHRAGRYYSDLIVGDWLESDVYLELLRQCDGGRNH